MKHSDIEVGKTYLFVATDSPARKHLEGTAFTVTNKDKVWRRKGGRRHRSWRAFNADGVAVRPDELGELPDDHCPNCFVGTFGLVECHNGREKFECDKCGHTQTFP